MPVPDHVRDDGSGIRWSAWIPAFAGMTVLRYVVAGVIKEFRRQRRLDSLNGMAYWLKIFQKNEGEGSRLTTPDRFFCFFRSVHSDP
jgi:hypothetical protein